MDLENGLFPFASLLPVNVRRTPSRSTLVRKGCDRSGGAQDVPLSSRDAMVARGEVLARVQCAMTWKFGI